MIVLPPVTFSTTNGWPSFSVKRAASCRATWSVGPPAENGTMTVTGRDGYSCAPAASDISNNESRMERISFLFRSFLGVPRHHVGRVDERRHEKNGPPDDESLWRGDQATEGDEALQRHAEQREAEQGEERA